MKLFTFKGITLQLSVSFFAWPLFYLCFECLPKFFQGEFYAPVWDLWGFIWKYITVFTCVMLHEYGHALTANHLSPGVCSRITLFIFGGMAHISGEHMAQKPKYELITTAAGPLVSITLALVAMAPAFLLWGEFFQFLFMINMLLFVFNLLPILPMDGGRVLRSILFMITRSIVKATRITFKVGIVE